MFYAVQKFLVMDLDKTFASARLGVAFSIDVHC